MGYGLYVHIPFCRSRCRYCDFYTQGAMAGVPAEYVNALLRDFARFAPAEKRPATVYFGGGTPSLLQPAQLQRLLKAFKPLPGAEVTLEANPESFTAEKAALFREAGVNRLSLGVQTARNESLARLGRLHTAADARRAMQNAKAAGFNNITGDIMLALPAYTNEEFDATLALLAEGGATHISAYLLKIEEGTAFAKNPPPGLPTPDEAADFYLYAVGRLAKAGYRQYEISNFAHPGYEGRHNLLYWNCEEYVGLGPGAHSCLSGRRFSFAADTAAFMAAPPVPQPEGTCDAFDYIMLRLRLAAGLDEAEMRRRYGRGLSARQSAALQKYARAGLAEYRGGVWALTPQGLLLQNGILADLL